MKRISQVSLLSRDFQSQSSDAPEMLMKNTDAQVLPQEVLISGMWRGGQASVLTNPTKESRTARCESC